MKKTQSDLPTGDGITKPYCIDINASLNEGNREQLGGKARGLFYIRDVLSQLNTPVGTEVTVGIPFMVVITTHVFDAFMQRNDLYAIASSDLPDSRIAHAFHRADMPFEVLGDLQQIVDQLHTPLAIRSSGLLEDKVNEPFAGVYVTKMIPNNQYDADIRFRKLVEAIKFVYASTFFKSAKDYCKVTGLDIRREKMAVIVQEIIGKRHHDRFYPELSGVARSYNYYPIKSARREDGVVHLALGLGKTIVDGGISWTYSPAFPKVHPPFSSMHELLHGSQTEFWTVNMGEPDVYDPINETEYMYAENITRADRDGSLGYLASTYDPQSELLTIGTGRKGARVLTFAPLLSKDDIPFNQLIIEILAQCRQALQTPVEIEFAMTFNPHHFGFLQVRPMVVPQGDLEISECEMSRKNVLMASDMVLGNGLLDNIQDIVFVKPETFDLRYSKDIARELTQINSRLLSLEKPYVLIIFGRLGTLDPWLGIPLSWVQVCGAKVIVESSRDDLNIEPSQGSHFFLNIINFGVKYFSLPHHSPYRVDWEWLMHQQMVEDGDYVCHIRTNNPLRVKVDGQRGRGMILK